MNVYSPTTDPGSLTSRFCDAAGVNFCFKEELPSSDTPRNFRRFGLTPPKSHRILAKPAAGLVVNRLQASQFYTVFRPTKLGRPASAAVEADWPCQCSPRRAVPKSRNCASSAVFSPLASIPNEGRRIISAHECLWDFGAVCLNAPSIPAIYVIGPLQIVA